MVGSVLDVAGVWRGPRLGEHHPDHPAPAVHSTESHRPNWGFLADSHFSQFNCVQLVCLYMYLHLYCTDFIILATKQNHINLGFYVQVLCVLTYFFKCSRHTAQKYEALDRPAKHRWRHHLFVLLSHGNKIDPI